MAFVFVELKRGRTWQSDRMDNSGVRNAKRIPQFGKLSFAFHQANLGLDLLNCLKGRFGINLGKLQRPTFN